MKGDQVLYIWPRFLDQSYSGTIYESVIKFMANQYTAAPASLTVTVTDNKTVLTWLAGTPGNRTIAGYGIYKSDASGKYSTTPTATVDASTLTWTDTLPAAGINSYYIVRAIDSGPPARTSGASPEASVITAFRVGAPSSAHGTLDVPQTLVPCGSSTIVAVHPSQGWKLATLFDNGSDVMSRVTATGYAIADIQSNHVLEATFDVIPDTAGPVITVAVSSSTNEGDVFITGSVTDDFSGVALFRVQESPVNIFPDSTFSATVHLMTSANDVSIEAVDGAGNITKKQFSIVRVRSTTVKSRM